MCVAIMLGVAFMGRVWRDSPRGERLRVGIGVFGMVYWIISNAWWNWPGNFELSRSLPIQVCDLAGLIGPLALVLRKRWLRALTYFWGIALSSQGFFQPVLKVGGAYTEFWLFWANHTIVVGIAIYDVIALGFRPRWKDYFIAVGALLIYAAVIIPFDIALGVNYGYIGNTKPENPTIIDKLGPWPGRLLPLGVIALGVMAVLQVPWWLVAKRKRGGSCQKCGYDLAGVSGVCPECGSERTV